jgi:hypothetical protein
MHTLWHRLIALVRGPEPPAPVCYDASADPVIRAMRLDRVQSERRQRHNTPIRRSIVERDIFPPRRKDTPCDA